MTSDDKVLPMLATLDDVKIFNEDWTLSNGRWHYNPMTPLVLGALKRQKEDAAEVKGVQSC
ncbi:hypothetical protein WCLP8_4870001 [uncultured Gammaproteobacteria bacterium]